MGNGSALHALKYRPEIDGLRFLAVILVILHHLEISLFSGGFIGVDVFFVISGYLITSILFKEAANGGVSFADFYKRRVVRLAPAFFVVVFFTSIAAYVLMLPSEIVAYAESLVSSVLFVANFYMWNEIGGYFVDNAAKTPLLHLWSLSVEEQFYIVWPFAIMALVFLKNLLPQARIPGGNPSCIQPATGSQQLVLVAGTGRQHRGCHVWQVTHGPNCLVMDIRCHRYNA